MRTVQDPKRDRRLAAVSSGSIALLWILFLVFHSIPGFLVAVGSSEFPLWIWFRTGYFLAGNCLVIRSGPLRMRIPVESIREIRRHTYSWVGIRPALSFDCWQVRYREEYEVFISPENGKEFLEEIRRQNPGVSVC